MDTKDLGCYACMGCGGVSCLGGFIGLIVLLCSITSLAPDEQVVVSGPKGKYVINGPKTTVISPSRKKEHRKAERLGEEQYAIVKNTRSGEIRHVDTPGLLWLGAYDETISVNPMIKLKMTQYMRLIDTLTGYERVLRGPQQFVPKPLEDYPDGIQESIVLGTTKAVLTLNKTSGKKNLVTNAPGVTDATGFVPAPYEEILEIRDAITLNARQFAIVKDEMTGRVRHIQGPTLFQPGAYDKVEEVQPLITLQRQEYIRLTDQLTGRERIVQGPGNLMPQPSEVYPIGVQQARFLDTETAVLVLNEVTGQERLITQTGVFFPTADEEIIEERKLIRVLPHEVVCVRDDTGKVTIHEGSHSTQTSFFLPAYSQVVEQTWSSYAKLPPKGQAQTFEPVKVSKIDMRNRKMLFSWEVRTSDNVRLRCEGTIYWKVSNVGLMINATADPEGDIWHHSRSALIQGASQSTLSVFMDNFNNITMEAFNRQATDGFYDRRGVVMISMELTEYETTDESVREILQEIVQGRTTRETRLTQQHSANEVAAAALSAEIQLELQKTELIKTQAANKRLEAQMQGEAQGMTLMRAADSFIAGLNDTVPNVTSRLDLYRLHETLNSQNTDTKNLATGKAQLYLTPDNANLKLVVDNAAGSSASGSGAQEL